MSTFLPTNGFKWIDHKDFDLNKHTSIRPIVKKEVFSKLILNIQKNYEYYDYHNDYPLSSDKIAIKREMLSEHQLNIVDLYKLPIGNIKKLVPNVFDKEKYVIHYENFQLYLRLGLKLKQIYRVLELNQSQWPKQHVEFNTQKRIEAEKEFCKLMNNLYMEKQ